MGYLGSTAVIIGLFFPALGQVLLTALLSLGLLFVIALHSASSEHFAASLAADAAVG